MMMKATLPRVGFIELLDRPSVAACHPADYFCLLHVVTSGGANARHHPRPNSTNMRNSVEGRRVHAVVRLRLIQIRVRAVAANFQCAALILNDSNV